MENRVIIREQGKVLHLKLVYWTRSGAAHKLKPELSSYVPFLLFFTSNSSTLSHSHFEKSGLDIVFIFALLS